MWHVRGSAPLHVCEQWEALSRNCTFLPLSFPATTSMLPLAHPAQGVESHREQLFHPFAIHSHLSPPALEPALSAEPSEVSGAIQQPGGCWGMTCPEEAGELASLGWSCKSN